MVRAYELVLAVASLYASLSGAELALLEPGPVVDRLPGINTTAPQQDAAAHCLAQVLVAEQMTIQLRNRPPPGVPTYALHDITALPIARHCVS